MTSPVSVTMVGVPRTPTVHIELGHDRGDAFGTAIQLAPDRGTFVTIDTFGCELHYTELDSELAALYEEIWPGKDLATPGTASRQKCDCYET